MRIAPHAVMDDGLMDVVVVERVGVPTLLRTLPKVFSGAHLPHPRIKTFRTTAARLESKDDMDLYGDGEYIAPLPLTLEVRPRHLNVVAPQRP
jgi:diacylglycerol kinase (ATP)